MDNEIPRIIVFIIGVIIGLIIAITGYETYVNKQNIKKFKDGKVLIICDDGSTNWYDMPICKKGDE